MTLKQWLKLNRQPEYSGINARQTLKRYGGRYQAKAKLSRIMLDLSIILHAPVKHDLCRMYLKRDD